MRASLKETGEERRPRKEGLGDERDSEGLEFWGKLDSGKLEGG
jgi:hypothetical protein